MSRDTRRAVCRLRHPRQSRCHDHYRNRSQCADCGRRPSSERGSAAVDFVLIGSLIVVLFLALIQLGLALHVRSTVTSAAVEGARIGARADRSTADAVARTRELIGQSVSTRYAGTVEARQIVLDGVDVIEVTVETPLPVIGLIGPSGSVTVRGHALVEPQ